MTTRLAVAIVVAFSVPKVDALTSILMRTTMLTMVWKVAFGSFESLSVNLSPPRLTLLLLFVVDAADRADEDF